MIQKQELFLYKTQTALGYSFTQAGAVSFAGSDLLEVLSGSKIDSEPEVEEVVNVAGALDQDPAVPGREPSKGTINMKMIPAIASGVTLPPWAQVLCGSCAFASAVTTTGGASNFHLSPISIFTSAGMIQYYTGNAESNGARVQKHYNLVGDFKITLSANKAPEMSIPLEGAFYGETNGTQPSVTKPRVSASALKGATIVLVGDSTYQFISGDISGNQAPQTTEDPSQSNGMGLSKVTDRKIKGTAKFYCTTSQDPKAALRASTLGAMQFKWGSSAAAINIGGSYAQFTKVTHSEQNGIHTYDTEIQWNRNDFGIDINPSA